jgi:hypothetical protein
LSVSQAWPLNCVTNTRSTLLNCSPWGQHKNDNSDVSEQPVTVWTQWHAMVTICSTHLEHSGVLWWQFAAHTWNTTHSYCLKCLELVKAKEKIVYLEDLTIQWWRNGQNNCNDW